MSRCAMLQRSHAKAPVFFAAPGYAEPSLRSALPGIEGSGAPENAEACETSWAAWRGRPARSAPSVPPPVATGGALAGAPLRRFLSPGAVLPGGRGGSMPPFIRAAFAALCPPRPAIEGRPRSRAGRRPGPPENGVTSPRAGAASCSVFVASPEAPLDEQDSGHIT